MMSHVVNANDTIAAVLERRPSAARVFMRRGMHCVGCAMARFETLADACATYGIATDALVGALNRQQAKRPAHPRRSSRRGV